MVPYFLNKSFVTNRTLKGLNNSSDTDPCRTPPPVVGSKPKFDLAWDQFRVVFDSFSPIVGVYPGFIKTITCAPWTNISKL